MPAPTGTVLRVARDHALQQRPGLTNEMPLKDTCFFPSTFDGFRVSLKGTETFPPTIRPAQRGACILSGP